LKCQKCGTTKPPIFYHIINYQTMQYTRLCKSCHNEEHGLGLRLVEIFEEHTPIVKGGSQYGRYQADYIIEKKPNPPQLTETELGIYVEKLQHKYPNEGFYMRKLTWKGKTLHVIAKCKNHHAQGRIPLYFDLQNQKYYIDKRDLQKNEKLANYIIMVTLGSLGISQSKYANGLRREVT
jgi:hypothetical protein